jgi:hypothetical protein
MQLVYRYSEEMHPVVTSVVPLHRTLCPTRRNFTTAVAATLRCVACGDEVGGWGCTSSRIQLTHSLKPPGYNP